MCVCVFTFKYCQDTRSKSLSLSRPPPSVSLSLFAGRQNIDLLDQDPIRAYSKLENRIVQICQRHGFLNEHNDFDSDDYRQPGGAGRGGGGSGDECGVMGMSANDETPRGNIGRWMENASNANAAAHACNTPCRAQGSSRGVSPDWRTEGGGRLTEDEERGGRLTPTTTHRNQRPRHAPPVCVCTVLVLFYYYVYDMP